MSIRERIEQDGFAMVRGVLARPEADSLLAALDRERLPRSRAGARHAMASALVAGLARDERLMRMAREVLGAGAQPFRATLFDKSPGANWLVAWHQDTALPLREQCEVAGWGPWSTKSGITYAHAPAHALEGVLALRIHLDDSTAQNGPLRVVPGSHRRGVLTDDAVRALAHGAEPVYCVAAKGDVLAMRPLLVHASSKSGAGRSRRVLHVEYAASFAIDHGLELAIA